MVAPRLASWLRRESWTLVALAVVAAGLFGFIRLASEIREGDTRAFDAAILLALRNPSDRADPIGPAWLEIAMRDITSLGSTTVLGLITVAVVCYLVMDGKRASAVLVVAAIGGGTLLSVFMKLGFERPRPDLVAHLVDVTDLSFPSGHAMLSAATYLTLGALLVRATQRRRNRVFILATAVLLTLMIGVSRVYLGVHWPTDVLGGWAAGSSWALVCWLVARRLQETGQVEAPSEHRGPLVDDDGTA